MASNNAINLTATYPEIYLNSSEAKNFLWVTEAEFETNITIITATIFSIALFGVVSNVFNIKTFILIGLKDGVTVTFMCLALSDFCATFASCIMSGSRFFITMEEKYDYWFGIDPFAIHLFTMNISVICQILTTLTTSFIAIARCMCVASPFKFKDKFTIRKCLAIFICFCFIAVGLWIPVYANMGMATAFDTKRNASRLVLWLSKDRQLIKNVVVSIVFVPFAIIAESIIIVCIVIMAGKLRESLRFRKGETGDAKSNEKISTQLSGKEKNVVMQVVYISVIFMICNLVKIIHGILMNSDPRYDVGKVGHFMYMTMSNTVVLGDCINSSFNFIVYFFFNSRFRSLCFKCHS